MSIAFVSFPKLILWLVFQWGTWKSGVSLVHTGIRHPKSVMKNVIPIVMAGVIGIYGLIVGVILAQSIAKPTNDRHNTYSIYTAMAHVSYVGITQERE